MYYYYYTQLLYKISSDLVTHKECSQLIVLFRVCNQAITFSFIHIWLHLKMPDFHAQLKIFRMVVSINLKYVPYGGLFTLGVQILCMGLLLGKIYSGLLHEVWLCIAIAEIGMDACNYVQMAYKLLSLKP